MFSGWAKTNEVYDGVPIENGKKEMPYSHKNRTEFFWLGKTKLRSVVIGGKGKDFAPEEL